MASKVDKVLVVDASSSTCELVRVVRQSGGVFLGMRDLYNQVIAPHPSWPTYFYLAKGKLAFTIWTSPECK